jgi:hypothetical protein
MYLNVNGKMAKEKTGMEFLYLIMEIYWKENLKMI